MTEALFDECVSYESIAIPGGIDEGFVDVIGRLYGRPQGDRPPFVPSSAAPQSGSGLDVIDVSVRLDGGTAVWPTSSGVRVERVSSLDRGDPANGSRVTMDVHAGTHVDAPLHFLPDGGAADALALEPLIGPAQVVDVGDCRAVSALTLEQVVPPGTERILLRTRNSRDGRRDVWHQDFVAMTLDAAIWSVRNNIRMVGTDYLSVQQFGESDETHRVLLQGGVAVVEGLDLTEVDPGRYTFVCLPLRLVGAEAAPARAILLPDRS
jgi:arylformamidase